MLNDFKVQFISTGIMLKQSFKEVYTQQFKEGNIVRLKFSSLGLSGIKGVGAGGKVNLFTTLFRNHRKVYNFTLRLTHPWSLSSLVL